MTCGFQPSAPPHDTWVSHSTHDTWVPPTPWHVDPTPPTPWHVGPIHPTPPMTRGSHPPHPWHVGPTHPPYPWHVGPTPPTLPMTRGSHPTHPTHDMWVPPHLACHVGPIHHPDLPGGSRRTDRWAPPRPANWVPPELTGRCHPDLPGGSRSSWQVDAHLDLPGGSHRGALTSGSRSPNLTCGSRLQHQHNQVNIASKNMRSVGFEPKTSTPHAHSITTRAPQYLCLIVSFVIFILKGWRGWAWATGP
jgi:hypothetical protein